MANVGRPRKNAIEQSPLSAEGTTVSLESVEKETMTPELTHTAVSLALIGNKWHIVTIMYDPVTLTVGPAVLAPQEDKTDAIYRFKVIAGDKVLPD